CVDAALAEHPGPVVLVPVPSRRSAVRARGHDCLVELTRTAAALLTAAGRPARAARVLRPYGAVADQTGLSAGQRSANLAGAMRCPAHLVRRLVRRTPVAHLVVCDDIITTGSTLREAQRAL